MHVQELWRQEAPAIAAQVAAKQAADMADRQLTRQAGWPEVTQAAREQSCSPCHVTPKQAGTAAEPTEAMCITEAMCSDYACSSGGCVRHDGM